MGGSVPRVPGKAFVFLSGPSGTDITLVILHLWDKSPGG